MTPDHAMDDWWSELEGDVLRCFEGGRAMAPGEIAGRLGISEAAAGSLLAMLAREHKVTICLVAARPDYS